MEAEELLRVAWKAVQDSGIPEHLQETALKEAIALLRESGDVQPSGTGDPSGRARSNPPAKKRPASKPQMAKDSAPEAEALDIDEDEFFKQLSAESGVNEVDLRDILRVTDGKIQVVPPPKDLGASLAEQAKTIISLVAGARAKGLHEKPVSSKAVRAELDRKHCYQRNNFTGSHLGRLKGFNPGSPAEILLNSKWIDDFVAAVDKAHGRKAAGGDKKS